MYGAFTIRSLSSESPYTCGRAYRYQRTLKELRTKFDLR